MLRKIGIITVGILLILGAFFLGKANSKMFKDKEKLEADVAFYKVELGKLETEKQKVKDSLDIIQKQIDSLKGLNTIIYIERDKKKAEIKTLTNEELQNWFDEYIKMHRNEK